ncbi:PadR family transcriptional regulator [Aestuariimicrobium ganziense]|uniref:PadR family transcriptional regulator n=1 Tax=Aestuariimicrobium ganziense TaxID=2773677 RepID=UPI00194270C3|nr:PadR family transcriptional regulator [Aestuariimicrobium ganziense]
MTRTHHNHRFNDEGPEGFGRPHHGGRGRPRGPIEGRGHREGGRPERGRRHGRGGRAHRGDVRTAVLLLLSEEPMHGYQLMQTIADRTQGRWTPSPGAIYPALNLLEDEGLVQVSAEGGRKLATLTDAGQTLVAEQRDSWADPFGSGDDTDAGPDLRSLLVEIREATRQVVLTGNTEQTAAAAELLTRTRRELYLLLAGE